MSGPRRPAPEPPARQRERLLAQMQDELSLISGYTERLLDLPLEAPSGTEVQRIHNEVAALQRFIAEAVS